MASLQCPDRADSVLAHFRNHGFSEIQISQAVRSFPQLLNSDFEKTILPKLEYFTSVGVSAEDLAKIMASNPGLLRYSLEKHIIPTHKLLTSMLPQKSVVTLLRCQARVLTANHSTTLLPIIRLLREQGMPQSCISMSLCHQGSHLLILKHRTFAQLVCDAKKMGFNMKNSTSLDAMQVLWCKNTFDRSHQVYMMRWGWSEDDVLSAFRKFPRSMLISEKKLMQSNGFSCQQDGMAFSNNCQIPNYFFLQFGEENNPKVSGV